MSVTDSEDTRDQTAAEDLPGPPAEASTRMSTAPDPDASRRIRGDTILASLRRSWRQLTSMRTALLLLVLLALAAVPGSILPQQHLNAASVTSYVQSHPTLGPLLQRIGLFDVFSAPWFAAIYLLLFVSLVGCLVPRIRLHARALRRRPPAAPRHLDRLPHTESYQTASSPAAAAAAVRSSLRRWRTEVREEAGGVVTVSAEKGYLRETGNLVFHVALIVLLVGVALGSLWGWKAGRLVVEGRSFCDSVTQFDSYTPGRFVHGADLPKFCIALDKFDATYQVNNEPRSFDAQIRYGPGNAAPSRPLDVSVNHPLRYLGVRTYLINHGFAPTLTVTDPSGQKFTSTTPFLPVDATLASDGVVKLPDAGPKQIGIQGVFTPTRDPSDPIGLTSLSPAPYAPALSIVVYEGNLGLDSGIPQSVYTLDQQQIDRGKLTVAGRKLLTPGQTYRLADGTTIRFDGYSQWASFQLAHDPGQIVVLIAAVLIVGGLICSLRVRRRRMWFRISPTADAAGEADGPEGAEPDPSARRSVIRAGGLARSDPESFTGEFAKVVAAARRRPDAAPVPESPLPSREG